MNELEDDLTLARYFPIDRFIGESGFLSAQSLYLPKLGKQHDPLEGLATKTTVKNILSSEKAAGNPGFVGQALLGVQGTMSKNATYVSCWTRCLEAKECSAKTYGNAALMVFTTVGKLKKIMPKTAKIRAVQYVDEIDDQKSISPDIINFQKRKNFGWEQEVRIIDYCAHKGGLLSDTLKSAPDHISYPFNPTSLISKIVLLPTIGVTGQISVRCATKNAGIALPKKVNW